MGLYAFSRPSGSGHIYNYIFKDGWYYLMDLLPMEKQYINTIAAETGDIKDYLKSKYISGFLIKCKSLEAYSKYFARLLKVKDCEHLFFKQERSFASPACAIVDGRKVLVVYPNDGTVTQIQSGVSVKDMSCKFVDPPKQIPDWGNINKR